MKTYRIAVVRGDGIGPEVIASALEILDEVRRVGAGFGVELIEAPAGAGTYLECGEALPASTLAACRAADAILLGACGLPDVRYPDGTEIIPQVTLRIELDLYAGIRPAKRLEGVAGALAGDPAIDLVVVRESTEGIFASLGGGIVLGDQLATDTQVITRRGTERVVHSAFRRARRRGRAQPRVTCVDKANILRSFAFFRKVFDEVAAQYPDVAADHLYVDAAAMELVRRPERFDVLVTENLLGDILSDLTAGLIGGLGVAPSADLGERHAVFQPCHGTAPDLAGMGVANPLAAILSVVMMLDHLADTHHDPAPAAAARRIELAVTAALASGEARTADLKGLATTRGATTAILRAIG
ncbi:3-isopropylmalate dehydrogenase [Singulisphaera sp. GP187]|uniref:isocitrate/isopropylmalate dehydrogenase family protein n=1 Tax=Singulisphaera sp. GP187 TaxID=1882752 RepID=UPI000929AB9D|nr:isocitrate/isopropylmalate dehydrogenase family protein [Singulisphaera sp. GP187]SIO17996.1 3-isopropylmalate dehydrogenase [Singulisphaera sp. GP187]